MASRIQSKRWCFTLNNYTNEEWLTIVEKMTSTMVKYCVIGEETGESGTIHLQGYVRFASVQRMTGVKKMTGLRAHVEKCKGSEEENKLYCTKDGKVLLEVGVYNTSIGRRGCPASMGDNVIALIDFLKTGKKVSDIEPEHYLTFVRYGNMIMKIVNAQILKREMEQMKSSFDNVTWKEWQLDLINYIKLNVDNRKIRWYVDEKGGQGKTFISRFLVSNDDCVKFENGKSADIKFGYKGQRCVIFDLSRSQMDHINYEVIESVKNGIVYNTK